MYMYVPLQIIQLLFETFFAVARIFRDNSLLQMLHSVIRKKNGSRK